MTGVDEALMDCELTRWLGDPSRCRWCDGALRWPARVWCSGPCEQAYRENHVWPVARRKCRERQPGCIDCPGDPVPRPGLLEVDHEMPCGGKRQQGCAHHQNNLRTRCAEHHAKRHREVA